VLADVVLFKGAPAYHLTYIFPVIQPTPLFSQSHSRIGRRLCNPFGRHVGRVLWPCAPILLSPCWAMADLRCIGASRWSKMVCIWRSSPASGLWWL